MLIHIIVRNEMGYSAELYYITHICRIMMYTVYTVCKCHCQYVYEHFLIAQTLCL